MPNSEYIMDTISGAVSYPFFDQLSTCTDDSREVLKNTLSVLDNLYNESNNDAAISVIELLYNIMGMQFPQGIKALSTETLDNFIFSFLLDLDDYINNIA